jgi:hypothetical protein
MVVFDELNRFMRTNDERLVTDFNQAIKLIAKDFKKMVTRELIVQTGRDYDISGLEQLTAAPPNAEEQIAGTKHKLESILGGTFLLAPYPQADHETLVKRLLDGRRPFKAQEMSTKSGGDDGYRDALIWFTICELLRSRPNSAVVFVSNNTSDFASGNNLHKDFLQDLSDVEGPRITYFAKLNEAIAHFNSLESPRLNSIFAASAIPSILDLDAIIDSEFAHDLLFETLVELLDAIDEDESNESFFVRSTFSSFVLLDASVSKESLAADNTSWIVDATYIAKMSLLYHHSYGDHPIDRTEQRGLRISAKLIVDTEALSLTNLSVLKTVDEPLSDCFIRAQDIDTPLRGFSTLIVEPSELNAIAKERVFLDHSEFEKTMISLGAERDTLNREDSRNTVNVFYVPQVSKALLEKYELIKS